MSRGDGGRADRGERGAATLLVVACLALLLLLGAALGVVTAQVRAHRMAQSAADLAALAGAAALQRGEPPCPAAAGVATANGAALTSCRPTGAEVTVAATVTGPRWLGQTADLTAEARAGPGVVGVVGNSPGLDSLVRLRSSAGSLARPD